MHDYMEYKDKLKCWICVYEFCRYISKSKLFGKFAFVGLAVPGEAGSWQTENKVPFLNLYYITAMVATCYNISFDMSLLDNRIIFFITNIFIKR